jgi:hypothetical protein
LEDDGHEEETRGGWKTEKTVVSVSQAPSEEAQRSALAALDRP